MASNRVTDRDRGAKRLLKNARGMKRRSLRVGIMGQSASALAEGSAVTVVDIGTIHEFGLGTVPERSFIRAWFDGEKVKNQRRVKRATEQAFKGKLSADQALGVLGAEFVGEVQKRISSGIQPELKDATVRRKLATGHGGSTPLVATGQLRGSISWDLQAAS